MMRGAIIGGDKLRYLHRTTVAVFATALKILFCVAADVGGYILRHMQEKRSVVYTALFFFLPTVGDFAAWYKQVMNMLSVNHFLFHGGQLLA